MNDETRIRNGKGGTGRCDHCDRGLAIVARRPVMLSANSEDLGVLAPEYGPCPYCELGARLEFPSHDDPRWPNGYWQGRDPETERPPREGFVLSKRENFLRAQLLMRRFGGDNAAEPLLGIDLRDEAQRLRLLEAAL